MVQGEAISKRQKASMKIRLRCNLTRMLGLAEIAYAALKAPKFEIR